MHILKVISELLNYDKLIFFLFVKHLKLVIRFFRKLFHTLL